MATASSTAATLVPERLTLPALRTAAADCRACALHESGTQTVFGEGPTPAQVMFVGEQPGDQEDKQGKPFVGPAGRILDRGLEEAGIDRDVVYITNVVKHFKWTPRGKRRIHQKPNAEEMTACRPWLDAEITVADPQVIVALGATAAQSLLGRSFRVTKQRGELIEWAGSTSGAGAAGNRLVTATVHPSSILRAPDDAARHEAMAAFVDDLRAVARTLG